MSKMEISRRDFLKGAAAGAASLAVMGLSGTALAEDAPEVMTAAKSLEKWDFEIPPAPIPEDQIAETIEDDIIIIGAGMSGLTTAVSAQEGGADVRVISAGARFSAEIRMLTVSARLSARMTASARPRKVFRQGSEYSV